MFYLFFPTSARTGAEHLLLSGALFGSRCSDSKEAATAALAPTIKLASDSDLSSFLTDNDGHTLYYFTHHVEGQNVCTAFYTTGRPLPAALKGSDFGTMTRITVSSGPYGGGLTTNQQLPYQGKPLYYYAGDNQTRGHVEGHGLLSEGDIWRAAKL